MVDALDTYRGNCGDAPGWTGSAAWQTCTRSATARPRHCKASHTAASPVWTMASVRDIGDVAGQEGREEMAALAGGRNRERRLVMGKWRKRSCGSAFIAGRGLGFR